MRQTIFNIIENNNRTPISLAYGVLMFAAVVMSIIPLMTREDIFVFEWFDIFACGVFIFDYIAKWATADYRSGRSGVKAFTW